MVFQADPNSKTQRIYAAIRQAPGPVSYADLAALVGPTYTARHVENLLRTVRDRCGKKHDYRHLVLTDTHAAFDPGFTHREGQPSVRADVNNEYQRRRRAEKAAAPVPGPTAPGSLYEEVTRSVEGYLILKGEDGRLYRAEAIA